jgi:hypothetical protein
MLRCLIVDDSAHFLAVARTFLPKTALSGSAIKETLDGVSGT